MTRRVTELHNKRGGYTLYWFLCHTPIKSHTCSIGFISGDIAGHGIVWTASCCKKCCTIRALCGLALSSINIGLSANATLRHHHVRFDWSHDHLGWTIRTWRRVHWSNESCFLLRPTDGRARIWHQRNTSFQANHILGTTAFGGGGVTVWGWPWNCLNSLLL
jgi:hypothetical protein